MEILNPNKRVQRFKTRKPNPIDLAKIDEVENSEPENSALFKPNIEQFTI